MNKKTISIIVKSIAILASLFGMILSIKGLLTFTYFTILSNIFIDIMLLIVLVKEVMSIVKKKELILPNSIYITKFLATISITLTFFVFLTILAPTFEGGILYAYFYDGGGSFCLHFVTPILAIIDFLFFDHEYQSKKSHSLYAMIPPLSYVLFIL